MRVVQKDKVTGAIIAGILNNDSKTLIMVYDKYLNSIKKLVSQFGRIKLDAEDVFQEGLTRAVVNIRNNKFKGDSSFHSYFYAICRNICLKEINKAGIETSADNLPDIDTEEETRWDMIQLALELRHRLDVQCRDIIDLRFNLQRKYQGNERLTPFDYIAEQLNIQTDNARQRFRRCMSRLTELFHSDPSFKEIVN